MKFLMMEFPKALRLLNVPGRPMISNCGTPTEKASEFLDYRLKPIMQRENLT